MVKLEKFKESLISMDDRQLEQQATRISVLLAKTGATPKLEHRKRREAIFQECKRRGKPEIYEKALKATVEILKNSE
jgi:hypothetical protein